MRWGQNTRYVDDIEYTVDEHSRMDFLPGRLPLFTIDRN